MQYNIRHARAADLQRILNIYDNARRFMEQTGNPNQWGKTNPPRQQLEEDIGRSVLYVLTRDDTIHGVFFYYIGEDPTYKKIQDGQWSSGECYGTIHRIAGDGSGGILKAAVQFALAKCPYLRIDTHEENRVMQFALAKLGFKRCGVIFLANGDPRIAYDLTGQKG